MTHAERLLPDSMGLRFAALRRRAYLVGLTGGIGAGKSLAAQVLQACGATVLDADAASHTLSTLPADAATAADATLETLDALRRAFGVVIFQSDGQLDRARLRSLMLSDAALKKSLEQIMHPRIEALLLDQAEAALASHAQVPSPSKPLPILIWDIPLLAASAKWPPRLHRVLCIDCEASTQLARVLTRNEHLPAARKLSPEQAKALIDRQNSRAARRAIADDLIYNERISTQAFASSLRQHYQRYQSLSTPHSA